MHMRVYFPGLTSCVAPCPDSDFHRSEIHAATTQKFPCFLCQMLPTVPACKIVFLNLAQLAMRSSSSRMPQTVRGSSHPVHMDSDSSGSFGAANTRFVRRDLQLCLIPPSSSSSATASATDYRRFLKPLSHPCRWTMSYLPHNGQECADDDLGSCRVRVRDTTNS
jgi:hypothetical protein